MATKHLESHATRTMGIDGDRPIRVEINYRKGTTLEPQNPGDTKGCSEWYKLCKMTMQNAYINYVVTTSSTFTVN